MRKAPPQKTLSTMERRVPKSDKYAHVQSVLNTGLSIDKVKAVTAREFAKRRGEIFFRITKRQLYELYREYEQDEHESITESTNNSGGRIVTYEESDGPSYDKPYLILDLRELEIFRTSHLLQARSFPHAQFRRDQMHPEIYKFRNRPKSLIILYCDDERVSAAAAKDLVDRGIDNVYLLTGGINEFALDYPSLIEGEVPVSIATSKLGSSSRSAPRMSRIAEDKSYEGSDMESRRTGPPSPGNRLTINKLERHNQAYGSTSSGMTTGRRSVRSEAPSTGSTMSVAESVISRAAARKGKF